jgi:hypothetical protein
MRLFKIIKGYNSTFVIKAFSGILSDINEVLLFFDVNYALFSAKG